MREYFITAFSSVLGIGVFEAIVSGNPLLLGPYLVSALLAGAIAAVLGAIFG